LHAQSKWTPDAIGLVGEEALDRAGAVEADHVVIQHLGKAYARPASEFMILGDDQNKPIVAKREGLQTSIIDGTRDNSDVGIAFSYQADNFVAQSLLKIHTDVGIGHQERTEGLGQKLGQRIGVGKDPHLAGKAARIGREIFLEALSLRENGSGMLE